VNVYLAQIHIPSLAFTIYGGFAGVHLMAGGQTHRELLGRTFLQHYTMVDEGRSGIVTISNYCPELFRTISTASTTLSTVIPVMQRKSMGQARRKQGEQGTSDLRR
jgi:hypothetical protein